MISMLAMAAMVSCTNEIEGPDQPQVNQNEPVEIKLNAGIIGVETKAAISSTLTEDLKVIFFRPSDAATATWTSGDFVNAIISKEAGGAITFKENADAGANDKKLYYPTGEDQKAYLAGYYLGTSSPTTTDKNVLSFTIDGTQDIMVTDGASGSKKDAFKSFTFKHLLTQIDIVLKGDAAAQAAFGKIKKVAIKSIPTALKLTLAETPTIESTNNDGSVEVYNDNTGSDLSTNTTDEIIGNTVMVYNGGTSPLGTVANKLTLEITSEKGGTAGVSTVDVTTINAGLEQGNKHVITLNFKEKIIVSATIAAWGTNGAAGTGEVD